MYVCMYVCINQVAVSLSGGEIIYFELDAAGQLVEMGTVDMTKEVSALDLGKYYTYINAHTYIHTYISLFDTLYTCRH